MRRFTPKHSLSLTLLAGLFMTLLVGVMIISTVQPAAAQRPQRTPSAGGAGAIPTIDLSGLQVTLPAADDLMAMVNALSASMGEDTNSLMATANAMLTAMPTFTGGLSPDDLAGWLESWSAYSLSFDAETGSLTVTAAIDEAMLNALIEEALTEADTGVSSVNVDFDDAGLIVITAEDVSLSSQLSGDLTLSVELTADDGEIVATLVDASLNGKPLPPAALAELTALLEEAVNATLQTPTGLENTVDDLVVTDEAILVVLSLSLSME